MTEYLEHCPFCGQLEGISLFKESENAHGGGVTYVYVRCSCGACGPRFDDWNNPNSASDATIAWNSRSTARPVMASGTSEKQNGETNRKGCGRKIHTPDPYNKEEVCGFQYMPNESIQLCTECGGSFRLR